MNQKKWWQIYPNRLSQERELLDKAGIGHTLDQEAFEQGFIRLVLPETEAGEVYVIFPDLYPYFRFQIYAPKLDLEHHQDPFSKNLCMIGRATDKWCLHDMVADYMTTRLPKVIKAGNSVNKDEASKLEEPQAEPFTDYFSYVYGTGIVMDGNWNIKPMYNSGAILIGSCSLKPRIQGAALEIWDESNNIIVRSDGNLEKAFSTNKISARWIRLDSPPKTSSPLELFNQLSQLDRSNKILSHSVDEGKIQIRAALFPEERGHREVGQGWIFVCRYEKQQPVRKKTRSRNNKKWR